MRIYLKLSFSLLSGSTDVGNKSKNKKQTNERDTLEIPAASRQTSAIL